MDKKEAAVIKVLNDIGLIKKPPLTPEQEELLTRALDPEEEFLYSVKKLFHKE